MFVRKFEGKTLEAVLSQVKSEMGPDALVLSTNEKKPWFGKPIFTVTAAFSEKKVKKETIDEYKLREIFPHRRLQVRKENEVPEEKKESEELESRFAEINKVHQPKRRWEKYYDSLIRRGFSDLSAKDITGQLVLNYSAGDLSSPTAVFRAESVRVSEQLNILSPDTIKPGSSWAFLGVGGAGKSTLAVKLALWLKQQKKLVSLCSIDGRKITGKNELFTYARVLKLPFFTSLNEDIHVGAISIIDTPSLLLDAPSVERDLKSRLENKNKVLVLDATMRLREMLRIFEYSADLDLRAVAFTRFDIATQFGVLFDFLQRTKLPLLGASLSQSFKTSFKFFERREFANFILKDRS